jgi:serine/threonine protein phosphatase 1
MRILAIGDIHGSLRAFDLVLEMICPQPEDFLITLGDYVDRGPDANATLDRLVALERECRLVPLIGNHDLMMLAARGNADAYLEWFQVGGKETLDSYLANLHWDLFAKAVPAEHWRFLEETCVPYHELDTHFFVHANVYPDVPLAEQPEYMLFWEKLEPAQSRPHESGKIMICGHSTQKTGRPLALGHAVCIDTWVYGDGWLTCLDVERSAYWQANEKGQTRSGTLD